MLKMGKYRHFKGGEYHVLGVALHSETQAVCGLPRAVWRRRPLDTSAVHVLRNHHAPRPDPATLCLCRADGNGMKKPGGAGFFHVYSTLFSDSTISTLRSFRLITTLTMRVNARVSTAAKR